MMILYSLIVSLSHLSEEVSINATKQVKHLVAVESRRSSWRLTQAAVRSCCRRTEPNAADSEDDALEMRSNDSLVNDEALAGRDAAVGGEILRIPLLFPPWLSEAFRLWFSFIRAAFCFSSLRTSFSKSSI